MLERTESILFIRLSSLGDVILTTPVIRAVKIKYPNLKIDFLSYTSFSDVYKYNPYIRNLYHFRKKENYKKIINELKSNKYDYVIDLQNNLRSRRISGSLKLPTSSFKKPSFKKFLLVNFKINRFKQVKSIPEMYAEAIPEIELDDKGGDIFSPEGKFVAEKSDSRTVALCIGAKHFTKKWLPEYFIELGKRLRAEGFSVKLIGGKSELEECRRLAEIIGIENACTENDFFKTCRAISGASVAVCNDSGLMHTACALSVPVIAIFGSTVKEFGFYPYNCRNSVMENKRLSCRPCSHIGRSKCPKGHFNCMREIKPADVFTKINKLINI